MSLGIFVFCLQTVAASGIAWCCFYITIMITFVRSSSASHSSGLDLSASYSLQVEIENKIHESSASLALASIVDICVLIAHIYGSFLFSSYSYMFLFLFICYLCFSIIDNMLFVCQCMLHTVWGDAVMSVYTHNTSVFILNRIEQKPKRVAATLRCGVIVEFEMTPATCAHVLKCSTHRVRGHLVNIFRIVSTALTFASKAYGLWLYVKSKLETKRNRSWPSAAVYTFRQWTTRWWSFMASINE